LKLNHKSKSLGEQQNGSGVMSPFASPSGNINNLFD